MRLTRFGIRQPVIVQLVLILAVLLGVNAYISLPRALDPDVSFEAVLVYTIWPGASAEEVETQITNEIEDELEGLSNLRRITSTSTQGRSVILVEFEPDTVDLIQAEQEVQSRVNRVGNLPAEVPEEPFVERLDTSSFPAFIIAVGSTGSFDRLRVLAEELQDLIERIPGVGEATIEGYRDRELWVEVDPVALEAHGLTLSGVVNALRSQNRNVPGGEIDTGTREYIVRTLGEAEGAEDLEEIILARSEGGGFVRVGDIAEVVDTFEEATDRVFLNGEPCLQITVSRMKDSNLITLFEQIVPVLERFRAQRGHECEVTLFIDTSSQIRNSIYVLESSAMIGLLLVAAILFLFIGWRNAIFALIGIPFAFLVTFVLIQFAGLTLNGVSLFALILVIGIIVDDAIVVLENVQRHMEDGVPPAEAALQGASEVALPVTASVSTTMAAFAPLLLVPGIMGQFIREIPLVVIFALAASLFEVFFMMPCHIARHGSVPRRRRHHHPILSVLYTIYHWLLALCLRWRWLTLLLLGGLLATIPVLIPPVEMFPESDDFNFFTIRFELPNGEPLEATEEVLERIREICETALPPEELVGTLAVSGLNDVQYERVFGSHLGQMQVLLTMPGDRERSTPEIMNALRPLLARIEGIQRVAFEQRQGGPPTGAEIEIRLLGESLVLLDDLADQIKDLLREASVHFGSATAVTDVSDNLTLGKEELRVRVDESRRSLYGVPTDEIFTSISAAFDGITAAEITIEDEDVEIVVRHPEARRADPEDLLSLTLGTQLGGRTRLREVVDLDIDQGFETIRHRDGTRAVSISADVDNAVVAPSEVYAWIEPRITDLLAEHPGYTYHVGGEEEENRQSILDTVKALMLGLALIYMILAAQFQSFVQPFIIMATIPFAAIGVMVGLRISGDYFTFPTMIGIVALTGIVVNDSLVLIDFINRGRRRHRSRLRAVIAAGKIRMRPILMTSVTTIGGLMPMVLGITGNPGIFKPMAVAICWGLAFATVIVLLIIPVIYLTVDDIGHVLRRLLHLRAAEHLAGRDEEIDRKPDLNPHRRRNDH
ncbi:efflux RND transporter permease subunit [Candidatus Sumerlaeota bacterium]|nr:efflux RND transporter permease subunit [Candidatus Sumerlaeota bacterium]